MRHNRVASAIAIAVCAPRAICATPFNAGAEAVAATDAATETFAPPPAGPVWFFPSIDWESITVGGRGGEIVKVTTLHNHGPGSFREAVENEGAWILVFELGGVIDLEKETIVISNSHITIAGQTAPSPGITLIRSGIDVKAIDAIIQHLRERPGDNGEERGSGFAEDSISTASAQPDPRSLLAHMGRG